MITGQAGVGIIGEESLTMALQLTRLAMVLTAIIPDKVMPAVRLRKEEGSGHRPPPHEQRALPPVAEGLVEEESNSPALLLAPNFFGT